MKPDFAKNIAAAAAAGLMGACAGGATSSTPDPATAVDKTAAPAEDVGELEAESDSPDELQLADCCKGLNECSGKGGCAVAGKHDCQGLNECKGQGGCNAHCPGD